MDALGLVAVVSVIIHRPLALLKLYGARGLVYYFFGNRTTWRAEMRVLGDLKNEDAFNFKKSVQEECAMISVAAAIIAQIAITGLGFAELSETHWVSRAFFLISLISSLMAVYYAATQQRVMGRLHDPAQIQGWIRGGPPKTIWDQVPREIDPELDPGLDPQLVQVIGRLTRGELSRDELTNMYFRPCVTAVLTISAPQTLLSSSLMSLILGIGVYFGFIWTRALDKAAGHGDSKKVMIVYFLSLIVCFAVYSISHLLQDNDDGLEDCIVKVYVQRFIDRWGSALERADRARSDADPIASLMRSRPSQAAVSRTE